MTNLRSRLVALETKADPPGGYWIEGQRMDLAQAINHYRHKCRAARAARDAGTSPSVLQANLIEARWQRRERFAVLRRGK